MSVLRILRNIAVLAILLVGGLSLRSGWAAGVHGAQSRCPHCPPGHILCANGLLCRSWACCPLGYHCCETIGGVHYCCP
jgi:hypothetical protein